jgi:hypothetical protein
MTRLEGWEDRLFAVIEAARHAPYRLGEHDCLRVACQSVQALTGVDLWPQFAGYTTTRQALAKILEYGKTLPEAVSFVLGVEPESPKLARRGDVCHYIDTEDHLGVCIGEHVAVLGPDGIALVPITSDAVRCCWRIG